MNTVLKDLTTLKKELKKNGDIETKLRFEIKELEKIGAEYQSQRGRLHSTKAELEKKRAKSSKDGYKELVTCFNGKITAKIKSIENINAVIEAHNSTLRIKRGQLKTAINNSKELKNEIASLNQENEIKQQKQAKQYASDRELAKMAGVPTPCIKNMLVSRLADGSIIIQFCGVGSKTGIRCKKRIIMPDKTLYRQDENDKEPILIPRGR